LLNGYQIKKIFQEKNLHVNKRLGQNFLTDKDKRDRIIGLCGINREDAVLEIGPGLGALTESIQPLCKRLIAVEKDKGLFEILRQAFQGCDNVEIVHSDILEYSIPSMENRIKVIGNLPYYISSPIIFHMMSQKRCIDSMFITVQKEVADRMRAKPGTKDYGILSLYVQYHCIPKILSNISGSTFFPVPAVDSSFVGLSVRQRPLVKVNDEDYLFRIIKAGFNQRRKTLFNALFNAKALNLEKDKLKQVFRSLGINDNARAEQLGLDEFAILSDSLS
jgi:16S rRNA (adenine1518-N6/adenine1519-N6)-dimethyltransferase